MAQVPVGPLAYPQAQQQQQFPGQQLPDAMSLGTPGTVLPNGQFVPNVMPGTPGAMNMGTPGTVYPNGQFVPNAIMPGTPGAMNLGTPGTGTVVLPSGQVVPAPAPVYSTEGPAYASSPGGANVGNISVGGVGEGDPVEAPVITREQQQFVGVPRGKRGQS